jgi:hypothetical protein
MRRDELPPGAWRFPDHRSEHMTRAAEASASGKRQRADPSATRHESLTPQERVMRSRMAAYLMHARHDVRKTTEASHAAFMARFLREVGPEQKLPEPERHRRAAAAKSAYFTRLAYLSAKKRHGRRIG